jgi:hypothetical protein
MDWIGLASLASVNLPSEPLNRLLSLFLARALTSSQLHNLLRTKVRQDTPSSGLTMIFYTEEKRKVTDKEEDYPYP